MPTPSPTVAPTSTPPADLPPTSTPAPTLPPPTPSPLPVPVINIVQISINGFTFNVTGATVQADGSVRVMLSKPVVTAPTTGTSGFISIFGENLPVGEPIKIYIEDPDNPSNRIAAIQAIRSV
eukprot:tig00000607_g2523.t1